MSRHQSNSILQGLKLDFVYNIPLVYDDSLNISYPENLYKIDTIYGYSRSGLAPHDGSKDKESRRRTAIKSLKSLSATDDGSTANLEAISHELLIQQEKLLVKVKHLHSEVDQLEKFLRKDKSVKPSTPIETCVEIPPSVPLVEQLHGVTDPVVIADLIAKEEQKILARIKLLHQKVDQLKSLKSNSSQTKFSFVLGRKESCSSHLPLEIVIHASPKNPPLSLLVVVKGLQKLGTVKTSTFVHSSVHDVPALYRDFLDGFSTTYSRQDADFLVTVIWREIGPDCMLLVNPLKQNPILAESNAIRYVFRLFDPDYDSPNNFAACNVNNKWLNAASKSLINGNSKEKQSAVRHLNSHLGKTAFLVGNMPGLIDAVVLSALFQTGEYKNATGNVKKWYQACCQHELFAEMVPFLLP